MREIEREVVVAIIFSRDGKMLMGKKDPSKGGVYPGCWLIPGGGIDEGETLEQALTREVREEVGIDISSCRVVPLPVKNSGNSKKTLPSGERVVCRMDFHYFEIYIDLDAENVPIKLSDDLVETRWFDREELAHIKLIPGGKDFFQNRGYVSK